jgi:hypothetical protein
MYSNSRKAVIAILLGLVTLLFAGNGLSVNTGAIRIDLPWANLFTILVAMAYGPEYGLLAGLSGGALYPFFLWGNNGYTNVLVLVLYLSIYTSLGLLSREDVKLRYTTVVLKLFSILLPNLAVLTIAYLYFYNPILSINPPFWTNDFISYLEPHILQSFVIKDSINFILLALAAEVLLKIPLLRQLLGLRVHPEMKFNNRIFLVSVFDALILCGVFVALDLALLRGPNYMHKQYFYLVFGTIFWSSFIVARVVIGFAERRLEVEHELRKNEMRFQLIAASADNWIWEVDQSGLFMYSNQVSATIIGYQPEELIGKKYFFDLFEPARKEYLTREAFMIMAETAPFKKFEHTVVTKDGKVLVLEKSGDPIFNSVNELIGYRGFDRDVTERKYQDDKLRASEEKFRKAFEISPDSISINRLYDGKYISVNQSFTRITGYAPEEVLGKTSSEANLWVNQEHQQRFLHSLVDPGYCDNLETKFRCKDGTIKYCLLSSSIIVLNGEKHVITMSRDITARKRSEEERAIFARAVAQSPLSIILTDLSANIEYANPKVTEVTGYEIYELIGENTRIFSSGELPKETYKNLWDTITSGNEWHGELRNKKKNGELFWEYVSISPIKEPGGNFSHYLAIKEDISERKKLEQGLIDAKSRAEAANKLKDAFIANISHEIRTPLNGILGVTSIISAMFQDKVQTDEKLFFTSIETSSKRLMNTVDMILNFSRLQVGEYPTNKALVPVGSLLQNLITEYKPIASKKSVAIHLEMLTDEDIIMADETAAMTIFANVLDNAVKFSHEGTILINVTKSVEEGLCVAIRDEGVGISSEYMQHLFEPYTQEDTGFGRSYEGVGLGLSIVRALLDLNNGRIRVESKKHEGSLFTICFPESFGRRSMLNGHLQPNAIPDPGKKNTGGRKGLPRLLLVEDDETNQIFISSILRKSYEVTLAPNGEDGLHLFNTEEFDAVLMDISLSESLNGLEVIRQIRAGQRNPAVPILVVTGHAFPDDRAHAFEAGCNDFISKPFLEADLRSKIANLIAGKS